MEKIKGFFDDFKSIFMTENVLKENEKHANIVTATTMLNLFVIIFISWLLSKGKITEAEVISMTYVVTNSFFGLFLPAIICYAFQGRAKWIKYMLLGAFIIILGTIDSKLSYVTAFLMAIPVILSARYYRKNFTILVSATTFLVFLIVSFFAGVNYIVNYQAIISAVLLYYVIAYASVQIAQSGKNMIERQKEITAKGTRIETELGLASAIQKSMLPSIFPPFPEHEEIDIYASMTPAREIGGDFYDMFIMDDRYLVINVADVSGKGIPASLFMMVSTILIKNISKIEKQADKIFERVNSILCEGNVEDMFITSWLGILDLETGKLDFVNAGHNPPLIYSAKKGKYDFLRTEPNMVMACMNNVKYEQHEIKIEPNDRIFLYTDGVVEAIDSEKEQYGTARLKEFLNSHLSLKAKENVEALEKELANFAVGVEQFDDITMLALTYKGKKVEKTTKTFKAQTQELSNVQKFIEDELKKHDYTKKSINETLLISEEIFVNIAKYAYSNNDGECKIIITFDKADNFICTFEDSGIPFDPLKEQEPDLSVSSKERKVGGLGVYLSKKIMDDITYEYKNNKNVLTIVKKMK